MGIPLKKYSEPDNRWRAICGQYVCSLNSLSVRVLYKFSKYLVSGARGAKSAVRPLFGHFYNQTKVKLTCFMF